MKFGWNKGMTERCKFRVKENFRTFAELLEAYTIEELQLSPRAERISIPQYPVSLTPLPSQQKKYIKYRYNGRLIYDPIIKCDKQNQTKLYFEVLDQAVNPRTNMPWARTVFRFNLIGSRDFTHVVVDVIDAGKPLLHALLKKLVEDFHETRTDIERYLQAEREETIALRLGDMPVSEGGALFDIMLENALKATKETLAYMFLKYEFEEKTVEAASIQLFDSNKEPLGKIKVKQNENWLDYQFWFDSLKEQHKAHELGLVDELWMALERLTLEDFPWLSFSAQEASKVVERVLARSGWQVNARKVGETTIYNIEIPGHEEWYVRVVFSPGVESNQFELSWNLQEQEKDFDHHIVRISRRAVTRFMMKVEHEFKKGFQRARKGQPKPNIQDLATIEQSEQAKDTAEENPWNTIPDYRWDRRAVQMLWEGHQDHEIAKALNVTSKTVTNRLSRLLQQYPDSVPTRNQLRRKKLNG